MVAKRIQSHRVQSGAEGSLQWSWSCNGVEGEQSWSVGSGGGPRNAMAMAIWS